MTDRENLVALLNEIIDGGFKWHTHLYESGEQFDNEEIASYLLANGVTIKRWIPVEERLPQEDEPEGATCEQVQVLLDNGMVSTGWCNRHTKLWWHLNCGETHFIGYDYEHTPVIAWMPLQAAPKEVE